ncbi:protein RecA [Aphanomyces invadans]|uniref:Protein RecA n=2 Tax=Aphanomyces invadans TaxID=157072 RepID=A0A024U3C3_9STRA|nr:protein RecA [Aphanomyces invadans]ETW00123.1 protein RecA [Aphanomyces invadans]|eukprot:XP_008871148.1 protein RecA [Aphanomyces invadans]
MMVMLRLQQRLTRQCVRFKKTKAGRGDVPGNKGQALQMAIRQIESNFGKGSLMQLGSAGIAQDIEVISTGSLSLDIALGVGGLPKGRVVEIYGPESSGKTTLALHCIAEAQKQGGTCAFVDAEHAIDGHYAKALGVNIDELYVSQPDSGEQALEIADTLIRSGAVDVVVVDSVAALVPRAELEGEMGDQQIALQARLMSQALRKLTGSLSKSNCMLIFLNQIRQKVGVLFGSPEVTSGGTALRYYASVRLDIRRKTQIKEGDNVVGNETVVKVAKNKLAPPFKVATFDMLYGRGIDRLSEVLDLGTDIGALKRSGSWYAYKDEPIGQGRAKAKQFLMDHPDVAAGIEAEIRQTLLARRDDVADDGDVVDAEEDRTDQVALDEEQIDPKDGLLDDRPMDATLDGTLEKA